MRINGINGTCSIAQTGGVGVNQINIAGVSCQLWGIAQTDGVGCESKCGYTEQTDEERERAFNEYVVWHNAKVAMQQSETLMNAFKGLLEAIEIAARVASGAKVSQEDLRKLLKNAPELYELAMISRRMSEQCQDQESASQSKDGENSEENGSNQQTECNSFKILYFPFPMCRVDQEL